VKKKAVGKNRSGSTIQVKSRVDSGLDQIKANQSQSRLARSSQQSFRSFSTDRLTHQKNRNICKSRQQNSISHLNINLPKAP
jgi:hypothetical protein